MSVTVYSKPACVQCEATYRHLDRKGIEYEVVDITKDMSALETFKSLGFMAAPVVTVEREDGTSHAWSGYRDTEIDALAAA